MKTYQAKSPCCGANVIRFGSRRRQCVWCRKTWRVRKKKTGRKQKRVSDDLVKSFLSHEIASMSALAKKKGIPETTLQTMAARSRDHFLKTTPWPTVPRGNLLLIADAVVEMIEGRWTTVYLLMVRGIRESYACILPPHFRDGGESPQGWQEAFAALDGTIIRRIKAVVCDGHRGILFEARDRGWIVQRCHFHLLARIQSRRSRFVIARNRDEAHAIFHHVNIVLKSTDASEIQKSLNLIEEIGWTSSSKEIRNVLSGFVTNYKDFRSYLDHPNLQLPTTNNTAESLASTIGHLKIRMRGYPTMHSFVSWVTALLKFRQKIKCNKHQPSYRG